MSLTYDTIFEDWPEYLSVPKWPRWLRRVFIITFPVSGPAWVVTMFAGMLVSLLACAFVAARDEWNRP